jgi:hypothetical protein
VESTHIAASTNKHRCDRLIFVRIILSQYTYVNDSINLTSIGLKPAGNVKEINGNFGRRAKKYPTRDPTTEAGDLKWLIRSPQP